MRWVLALLVGLSLASCTSVPSPQERWQSAERLARSQGWEPLRLQTTAFDLQAYAPGHFSPADELTVYMEGDGLAWRTATLPSDDPTPVNPVGLMLALAHPADNVAYLARPCQYGQSMSKRCDQRSWTDARFSAEVINASGRALDQLKARYRARRLTLVGYSGGGTVAALLAARRTDVVRLVTVAGNLDHRVWTHHHRLTPLSASLNPADDVGRLARIWQWHFVGSEDRVIPAALVHGFAERFAPDARPIVRVQTGYDHHCCWVDNWPDLWRMTQAGAP